MVSFRAGLQAGLRFTLYQARMIWFWGHAILPVVTIGVVLILAQKNPVAAYRSFYEIFEVLFPFGVGFLFIDLILREQHQRTLVMVSVTQCSLSSLFILRLLLTISYITTLIVILALVLQLSPLLSNHPASFHNPGTDSSSLIWPEDLLGGPNNILAILLTIGAPTLFLAGIGTVLAHLTADVRVGYLSIFALWMFNRAAGITLGAHPLLNYIYLFARSEGTGNWVIPKLVQLVLGTIFLALSSSLLYKPENLHREI